MGESKEVACSHRSKLVEGLRLELRTSVQDFRVKEEGLQLSLFWEMES